MALAEGIAVASGKPMLGNPEWTVKEALGVIIFAAEGGIALTQRRLQRIARDLYGIDDISDLPLVVLPEIAQFGKDFNEYLSDGLSALGGIAVGLIVVDSVYNYHPSEKDVTVSNLYSRGQMFGRLSHDVYDIAGAAAAMKLLDHFRKRGNDALDLDSISQSGMGEFADSWCLLNHRTDPDVDNGRFYLQAEIGSRQDWPGAGWEIDWDIGAYDMDSGTFSKRIEVKCIPCRRASSGKETVSDNEIQGAIMEYVGAHEWQKNKTNIRDALAGELGVGDHRVRPALELLAAGGRLSCEVRPVPEGDRLVKRQVWGVTDRKRMPR
jgi:hypothetical protein